MGSETKNALSTMVSASGFEVSATNHTPWPWPSPWLASNRAARGSFRMLQCAFCCCCYFFSEQPQGPNLNAYLQSASMLVFWLGQECDFESDGLILPTCPASVSSMAVWGCGFLEEERKGIYLGYVGAHLMHFHPLEFFCPWDWTTASPKSSKCAGPQHQLFCHTAYQCRSSLQV